MDYLAAMRAFVRAVDLGSFSKAADEMDVKASTVSRFVSALEDDLGAALLNRSTRALDQNIRSALVSQADCQPAFRARPGREAQPARAWTGF